MLTGTAALGAAMAGAEVRVRCARGNGTASVGADGRFAVNLGSRYVPPCLLQARTASTVLHGVTRDGGLNANITPLTELALARATGGATTALFDDFNPAAQGRIRDVELAQALQAVEAALQGRVSLAGFDPFTTPFAIGDGHDLQLDALMAALGQARTSLDELGAALAASGDTPGTVRTLLQPAAATCTGLRSGRYRLVDPNVAGTEEAVMDIDAAATLITAQLGAVRVALVPDPQVGQGCRYSFTDSAGTSQMLVSPSGLALLLRKDVPDNAELSHASLAVPEQSLRLSDLAGVWNLLAYARDADNGPLLPVFTGFSVAANGTVSEDPACAGAGTGCNAAGKVPLTVFAAHGGGGFKLGAPELSGRAFAFKPAGGQLSMLIRLPGTRGLVLATRQQPLALPAVGTALRFWDVTLSIDGSTGAVNNAALTVDAVDAATRLVTRRRSTDNRLELQRYDDPLPGMFNRGTNSCTPAGCAGTRALPLPGTGMTVYGAAAPATFFSISVARP